MKNTLVTLMIGALMSTSAVGAQPVKVEWKPVLPADSSIKTEWVQNGEQRLLKIVSAFEGPIWLTVATIENPAINSDYYGIQGRVKYDLEGPPGILEMWNHFPGKGTNGPTAHFSRTMAEFGLLAKLSGTSDFRDYRLPFNAKGTHAGPSKLVVNVHFAGKGTVWLSPATLHEYANPAEMFTAAGAWWPVTWAGWIGGCLGTVFGCFGGLIGYLSGKGRAREFVLVSSYVMIALGGISLLVGIVAVSTGQPYHVFYPLLLLGVILTTVMLGTRKQMNANYQAAEEKRMAAMDTLGSMAL